MNESNTTPEDAAVPPPDAGSNADADEGPVSLLTEFWWFLRENKKWWLIPIVVVFVLLALVILISYVAGPLSPFLYTFL